MPFGGAVLSATQAQHAWYSFWDSMVIMGNSARGQQYSFTVRFTEHLKESPAWDNILANFGELEATLTTLVNLSSRLYNMLVAVDADEVAADVANFCNTCNQYISDLNQILDADPGESITWLEHNYNQQPLLRLAPLHTGTLLAESLFTQKQAIVLTSATITVNNSFNYYLEQVGLNILPAGQVITCQVSSPFDYQSQALVCAIKGLPNPSHLNDSDYARAIAPVMVDVLASVEGRVLVLCTSHRFLREIYKNLNTLNTSINYTILAQGIDGNRNQLLEEFRQTHRAVLLGASSFWEGIDLPGDLLRCVIMPRLPFPSPGVPAHAARMEHLAAAGFNSFNSLSLPQAIIRFRQGFGRLIRRATDLGALVVLDQRLLSQRYGRFFLQSLPPVTNLELTPDEVTSTLPAWFKVPPPH